MFELNGLLSLLPCLQSATVLVLVTEVANKPTQAVNLVTKRRFNIVMMSPPGEESLFAIVDWRSL